MSGPSLTVNPTQVLAGPVALYVAKLPWSTGMEPTKAAVNVAPAVSAWNPVGSTSGGITVTTNQSMFVIRVDQVPERIGNRITERDVLVAGNWSEATLETLAIALNEAPGGSAAYHQSTTVSSEGSTKSYEPAVGNLFPTDRAFLMDGFAPGSGKRRRLILRRCNSIENVGMPHQKDGITVVPVTLCALYIDASTSPVRWDDEQ